MNRYTLFSILLHGTFCLFLLIVPYQKRRTPFHSTYSVSLRPTAVKKKKKSIAPAKKKKVSGKKRKKKDSYQEEVIPDIETPESDYAPEPELLAETPERNMIISKEAASLDNPAYFSRVRSAINYHWATASWNITRNEKLLTTISFRIGSAGTITMVRVEKSSGVALYDTAAIKAVKNASPLPSLPEDYTGNHVDIFFDFAYERK